MECVFSHWRREPLICNNKQIFCLNKQMINKSSRFSTFALYISTAHHTQLACWFFTVRIILSYLFHQVIHYPSIGRITNKQNLWNKKPILLALRYLGKAKKCATKEHPWRRFANLFLSQTRFGVFVGQNVMRTRVRGPLGFTPETRARIAAVCAWKHPGTCWKMFIR